MSALPAPVRWSDLDETARRALLRRPAQLNAVHLLARVREIVTDVRERGDAAVRELTRRLDGADVVDPAVRSDEFAAASAVLTSEQHSALDCAIDTVSRFHALQMPQVVSIETIAGVVCERLVVPLDAVGLYVPAGTAPLPSTAIMLAVPASLAGCPTRVLCTPPRPDGTADPAVLVAARRAGVEQVFKIGGAQAIAAMAYGTDCVPKVAKVFGPGNAWVTAAKQLVAADPDGAALDLPAGPSEVLVIADESAAPEFVAADLLAQAEHSDDAQVMLVTTSPPLAAAVSGELGRQLEQLSRREIVERSIAGSRIVLVDDLETAFEVSNRYAPEHLIIQVESARDWLPNVRNAGSVFLGRWTPETLGDYCSGTNHVLPTYGHARAYSGLGLAAFVKQITVQEASADGLRTLGPVATTLAQLESLDAHANAVGIRLRALAAGAPT
jgi:histidinol dehydrogenase